MLNIIERGIQMGVNKKVKKGQKYFWYEYAVQKKENIYYVYEYEISEENMDMEVCEYENVYKYLSLDDVINNFPNKYGISFKEIHPLKGQRIFNVDLYIDD